VALIGGACDENAELLMCCVLQMIHSVDIGANMSVTRSIACAEQRRALHAAASDRSTEVTPALDLQGKRIPVKVFAATERGAQDKVSPVKSDPVTAASIGGRSAGHDHSGSPASAGSGGSATTRSTLFSDGSSVLANTGTQPAPRRMQPMVGRQVGAKACSGVHTEGLGMVKHVDHRSCLLLCRFSC